MALTEKDVDHVAKLARLEISAAERELYTKQLGAVLEHADGLKRAAVEGVQPTAHVLDLFNVLRADETRPSLTRDAALKNAPDKSKGCFKVPKILEQM
jgi:aspartyl-tRNA(Asn)/glutamyl-tRNA(Gln) amidotransferase subunit C